MSSTTVIGTSDSITVLGLRNCNISLRCGKTRGRTVLRGRVTTLFAGFPNLMRLDLSGNTIAGCLRELLNAVARPLEYLGVAGCNLLDADLDGIATSRHAASLRELDVTRVCGYLDHERDTVRSAALLRCVYRLTYIMVLRLAGNHLTNSSIDGLCVTLNGNWLTLKSLIVVDNPISPQSVLRLVLAAVRCPILQHVAVPYAGFLFRGAAEPGYLNILFELKQIVRDAGRSPKMCVELQIMSSDTSITDSIFTHHPDVLAY